MKSLVTGGAGFIGSHVAKHCLALGHSVTVLDDLSGGFVENVPRGAELVKGSITDASLVRNLFGERRFDFVYHLGAYAAEGLSHFIRRFNYETNLIGSMNIINESVKTGVRRLVFTSSIAVYGVGQVPITEEQIPRPEDPYGISKYAVELDLECAHRMWGLEYVIFRPHNVYGEHQNIGDRYRNVIGIFMNQVMSGKEMTIFGDGTQTRAFTYIDDVAPQIAKSAIVPEAANQIFNIGADVPYRVLDVAKAVASAYHAPLLVQHLPARQEVLHAWADHAKARRILGAGPGVTLEDGIKRMADWARDRGVQTSQIFANIEVEKGMPPAWAADLAAFKTDRSR